MKDTMIVENGEVAGKKKAKVKTLKESNFSAGLAALEALEGSDVAARPVALTARVLVQEGIGTIVRLRAKNVPLLRIYNDMRKASGMKITFETFAGYVSDAAKKSGLKFEKVKQVPRHTASADAGTAPTAALAQTQAVESWNCDSCLTESQRHESTKKPGAYYWKCARCGTFYADSSGTLTTQKL